MNVELNMLKDGRIILLSDEAMPHLVKRVEYYREQRLFMLVYQDDEHEGDLMHYEIPEDLAYPVEKSPNVIIYSMEKGNKPSGYRVPLIKVGNIY